MILVWMVVHIYSVKAKSQAGNMSQIYNDNIKKSKTQDIPSDRSVDVTEQVT